VLASVFSAVRCCACEQKHHDGSGCTPRLGAPLPPCVRGDLDTGAPTVGYCPRKIKKKSALDSRFDVAVRDR
jgi:hypothetical protein